MGAEEIAKKARASIGKFCMEECKAFCCRKGFLPLFSDQVEAVTQGHQKELLENGRLIKNPDGKYSLKLSPGDCPSLNNFKCLIYTDPLRPKNCDIFPIQVCDGGVKLSPRCLAVKSGKFFPYVKELIAIGCKVEECDPFVSLELYDFEKK